MKTPAPLLRSLPVFKFVATAATLVCLSHVEATATVLPFSDAFGSGSLGSYTQSTGRSAFSFDATNSRLSVASGATSAVGLTSSIGNFNTLRSVTLSLDFLTGSDLSSTGNIAGLGAASTASTVYGNSAYNGFEVSVRNNSSVASPATAAATPAFLRFRVDGVSTGQLTSSPNFTLNAGTWYTLTLTLTQTAPTGFSVSSSVIQRGSSTLVTSFTATGVSNSDFLGTTAVHAGFAGILNGAQGGAVAVDNFSVIPEPSSAALVFGALALAAVGVRRRRRV